MLKAINRAALAAGLCGALLAGLPAVADAQVNVSIYQSSGAPALGDHGALVGSFSAAAVDFGNPGWYWTPLDQTGDFYAVVTGVLNVATTGYYNIGLTSDDGSFLRIDGGDVLNAWYVQGPTLYETGPMLLAAGLHAFQIDYFECCGNPASGLVMDLPQGITYAVPEPETYAMLLAGLGLLGGAVRRRKTR